MVAVVEERTSMDDSASVPWWQKSSLFGCQSQNECSPTVVENTPGIGGAKAQSRFLGKTALPMFREAAMSEQHSVASTRDSAGDVVYNRMAARVEGAKVGYRCDGRPVVPNQMMDGGHGWVFSFEEWAWKRKDSVDPDNEYSCKNMLAARRWGDGRDDLILEQMKKQKKQRPEDMDVSKVGEHVGFDAVGGFEDVKHLLREQVVIPLKYSAMCRRVGVSPGRGILVHGPSGCGKTHLLERLGEECGVFMCTVSSPECVGNDEGENKLKQAFQRAKSNTPSILFFDNFEALVPNKRAQTSNTNVDAFSTNLFISLLDNLRREDKDVTVVCATNSLESIDPSLRRHGRLDCEIFMGSPLTFDERSDILQNCILQARCAPDVNLEELCAMQKMHGFMASDVAALVQEAAFRSVLDAIDFADGDENILINTIPEITMDHLIASLSSIKRPGVLRPFNGVEGIDETSWDDIGGLESVKQQLIEMVEWPTKHESIIQKYGMRLSAGALLYGAPGCGKTMLAKAVASSCKANFMYINGPEILQKWMGESEGKIREMFAAARLSKPCVLFIDEIDALAPRRRSQRTSSDAEISSRIVAQLLCEIDGVGNKHCKDGNHGVVVLGATNRPDAIEAALLRPGRLSEMIHVPLPDTQGLIDILQRTLRKCPKSEGLNLESFVEQHAETLQGCSGADIVDLGRRAVKELVRASIQELQPDDSILLDDSILTEALAGMRKSVSSATTAYYSRLVEALASGKSFNDVSHEIGNESTIPLKLAVSITQQVVKSHQEKCAEMENRIQELEALLQSHGVDIIPV
jgi:SpoVK/Ycf46/Vps4 family AAA+-type ATPase